MGDPRPYYAEAFTVMPGRRFRLITRPGHRDPNHCPEPVVWHGTFTDRAGKRHELDACDGHASDLDRLRPSPEWTPGEVARPGLTFGDELSGVGDLLELVQQPPRMRHALCKTYSWYPWVTERPPATADAEGCAH
jgi:hypothetical protein